MASSPLRRGRSNASGLTAPKLPTDIKSAKQKVDQQRNSKAKRLAKEAVSSTIVGSIPTLDATTFLLPTMTDTDTITVNQAHPVTRRPSSFHLNTHTNHSHASQTYLRRPSATPSLASAKGMPVPTKPSTAERNIDNVVFGDVMFRAWYPSPYVKEVVGKEVIEEKKIRGFAGLNLGDDAGVLGDGDGKKESREAIAAAVGAKGLQPDGTVSLMLERLFVCRWCFAYTRHVGEAVGHRLRCQRRPGQGVGEDGWGVPGRKIYTHPLSKEDKPKLAGKSDGVWSVWEVDGEVDMLYCQCLCLFAKLFLDNKSVFFDVTNFYYYLLVHTSTPLPSPANPQPHPEHQVVGFFSKEKMSWDNNNLACILLFPPWQRKSLGLLLIAISYEISRRESILGGPEKPISDLGRRGYMTYWTREIARWLLDVRLVGGGKAGSSGRKEITVEDVSRGTWIAIDDCVASLREMGVAVELEPGTKSKGEDAAGKQKVSIEKDLVREWAERKGVQLGPVIDADGFLEGYGYRVDPDEEMEM